MVLIFGCLTKLSERRSSKKLRFLSVTGQTQPLTASSTKKIKVNCERLLSELERTLTANRSTIEDKLLQAFLVLQVHMALKPPTAVCFITNAVLCCNLFFFRVMSTFC